MAMLREHYVDRIYDTYIDEEELQHCDRTIKEIADALPPRPYSSRAFIREMGRWLAATRRRAQAGHPLVQTAFEHGVPIFCPAFSDSSAGFGLVAHQVERPGEHLTIDSVADFRELTELKMQAKDSGLLIIGGGSPKNFAQDTVVCAEILGKDVPMHKYSIQITVADVRDGACSSSSLKEAGSWGKVDAGGEQMVFAEATLALPLLAAYGYHNGSWRERPQARARASPDPALMVASIINCERPESADAVLISVPYGHGASFGGGAGRGPAAIVACLDRQIELFERHTRTEPALDYRIAHRLLAEVGALSPEAMVERVAEAVARTARSRSCSAARTRSRSARCGPMPPAAGRTRSRSCRSTPISTCATTTATTTTTTPAALPIPA